MARDRRVFMRLRQARRAAFRAASAVDGPVNWLNHKRPYPPIHLRREVGPLKVFEASAASMVSTLRYTAGLAPESRLLDMGCGCGALPLVLNLYDNYRGEYHGMDVDRAMIDWCQGALVSDRMRFSHHDYWSGTYNPSGTRQLPFAVENDWADVIVMKSVITHMLPEDTAWYLRETKRTLAPGGTAVITALLYEQDGDDVARRFPHSGGVYRYIREESPESSIALQRLWIDEVMDAAGLAYEYEPGAAQGPMYVRHA